MGNTESMKDTGRASRLDMNEKSAIAANHPPNRSARLRKWVRCALGKEDREQKPLDPAGVVRDLSEARFHKSVKSGRGALRAFDRAV